MSLRVLTYSPPLQEAVFIKRYKRFLVDVRTTDDSSSVLTVHCANSGSMKSCLIEGCRALIQDSEDDKRKLRYSLESLLLEDGWACLNTQRANQVFATLMERRQDLSSSAEAFPGVNDFLKDFGQSPFRREASYDAGTRFDGLIDGRAAGLGQHWIEIKSVSLRLSPDAVAFPDAVTERGQKHLRALKSVVERSTEDRATLVYALMRGSNLPPKTLAHSFRIAADIDPDYSLAFQQAQRAGVAVRMLVVGAGPEGLDVRGYFNMPNDQAR